ncbi:MAG: DUF3365 domain-containing protein [Nitrospiraceae bacterium]|nr:DUF3365 domain-containing protein [Nitrospiraceae bacterium]
MLTRETGQRRMKQYLVLLIVGWSIIVACSIGWNIVELRANTYEKARIEARTFYEVNLVYRHWAAERGGVYVPVTDTFKPNPYLKVPDRDVVTTTGKKLTLVNPAWMTRQVFEALNAQSKLPIISHLTSLRNINPANRADAWEEQGLRSFEQGAAEASAVIRIGNAPYMRVLKPFVVEQACLTCHAAQGYRVGDIRGGMSIALPLGPYLAAMNKEERAVLLSHIGLWFVGIGGIVLFTRRIDRHQRRILESEQKYRALFANNPHPMWVYDLETLRFLAVNDAAVRHYGYSQEEFLSMTIKDIRPPEDISPLMEKVARVTAGVDKSGTWRHRTKDGSVILVDVTSHILDFSGRRAKLVLANDITEHRRLEDQLRQAQKMEAVGLLAGGVAHDFNNALTAIIGCGSLIQMKLPPGDPLRAFADSILATSQRAAQLTQRLLAFSRKQIINPAVLDLNTLISRLGALLKRLIREDIELRLELCGEETPVMADSVQIEQVLMNLATNARDAMPTGGVLAIATAVVNLDSAGAAAHGATTAGHYVRLTVSDTGAGMDERTRTRIFEPFFTTKETGRGTGLGLAMAYGIIQQHNGFMEVESSPGKGTRFHIYLPVTRMRPATDAGSQIAPPPGGKETILVAEDDEVIRNLTRSILTEFGYTVLDAENGEDAVRLFRENRDRVRLVLLDVIMPKKNGRAALEEIRALKPDVRALFISGYDADVIGKEGLLAENLSVLTKPLSPAELLRKVRSEIDR